MAWWYATRREEEEKPEAIAKTDPLSQVESDAIAKSDDQVLLGCGRVDLRTNESGHCHRTLRCRRGWILWFSAGRLFAL